MRHWPLGSEYERGVRVQHVAKASDMSHRDWLAGQALPGVLTRMPLDASPESVAQWAYKLADAMLGEANGTGR